MKIANVSEKKLNTMFHTHDKEPHRSYPIILKTTASLFSRHNTLCMSSRYQQNLLLSAQTASKNLLLNHLQPLGLQYLTKHFNLTIQSQIFHRYGSLVTLGPQADTFHFFDLLPLFQGDKSYSHSISTCYTPGQASAIRDLNSAALLHCATECQHLSTSHDHLLFAQ